MDFSIDLTETFLHNQGSQVHRLTINNLRQDMPRDPSNANHISAQLRRFSWFSLGFLLVLATASGIFVYQVSPLRDPSFQANSGNAGSLMPWLQGVSEGDWLLGALVLAVLLASNLVFIFWQNSRASTISRMLRQQGIPVEISRFLLFVSWVGIGAIFSSVLWIVFLTHLLSQWLVD